MLKKIFLIGLIAFLLAGSAATIGWIGFQEHFRLLAGSFRVDANEEAARAEAELRVQEFQDRTIIETPEEAQAVLNTVEGWLRGIESDGLPEE